MKIFTLNTCLMTLIQSIRRTRYRATSIFLLSLGTLSCSPTTGVSEASEAAISAPAKTVKGIDVSKFQGQIDWRAVKASGVIFAFARALEGDTIHDSEFAKNWQGMKKAGVIRGAYDFYVVEDSPETQLEAFISLVSLEPGDLPPMVDIEQASITARGGNAPTNLMPNLHKYLALMEAHFGVMPIIYTNPSFWNEYMDDSFGHYPLWVAEYGVDPPTIPKGWDNWMIWQNSDSGKIDGIEGAVDLDVFNGSLESLRAHLKK